MHPLLISYITLMHSEALAANFGNKPTKIPDCANTVVMYRRLAAGETSTGGDLDSDHQAIEKT